jgi:hypothetical protein
MTARNVLPPAALGARYRHRNGLTGTIDALLNGGALAMFTADTGARFTIAAFEVAPITEPPLADLPPIADGVARVIVRFDPATSAHKVRNGYTYGEKTK